MTHRSMFLLFQTEETKHLIQHQFIQTHWYQQNLKPPQVCLQVNNPDMLSGVRITGGENNSIPVHE